MTKLFTLILLLLLLLWMPVNVTASEELHAIKEHESTNQLYDRAIQFFTRKMPEMFEKRLNNSYQYIDLVTEIFQEKEIPVEIAYLPLIESEFSPLLVGPGNAVGLWQFVKGTARKYGLRIDKYVDERKDPVKSTYAAAYYLRDLHSMFGAWDIALAAYNAGEGRIKRILNRCESACLPVMIKRYLASFMAAFTIAQNPEQYGFESYTGTEKKDMDYREIITDRVINLKTIAEKFNTTVKAIKQLNPALLTDTTPPYTYMIRLPNS
jgi:membrane-bound lytic murein transglycosylase D